VCASCPPGSYNPDPGASQCTLCEAGKYNPDPGAIACTPCEPGSYNPDLGAIDCTPCPAGQYSDIQGAVECTDCPNGTYNNEEGQTSCLSCPEAVCPGSFSLCVSDPDFDLLTLTYSPLGGTFSGPGVTGNTFSPSVAGVGSHLITYMYEDENDCSGSCTFNISVSPANSCASFMEWVLLPSGYQGNCSSETDCCEDILCYGLKYTPGTDGFLLDYTTGFLANCINGLSPIISNESCVMTDNSDEQNDCMMSGPGVVQQFRLRWFY
jgi:hypothetical protein